MPELAPGPGPDFTSPASLIDVDYLLPAERARLAELLELQVGGEGLVEFINRLWPDEPVPRHLIPLALAVERARVMPIRLCISMPPGGAKTTFWTRALAWWMTKSPADLCAYTSFSADQARKKNAIALANTRLAGVQIVRDSAVQWLTSYGGGVMATGPGGVTGNRIPGLLIYDDPYKDALEAGSEKHSYRVYTRFKQVARTRLQGGSIIVVHTRWDENDLIGRLKSEGWETINIAAIWESGPSSEGGPAEVDPMGRAEGESFWPERYPIAECHGPCGHDGHLAEIKAGQDDWTWESVYQGRPTPLSGGMFDRKNLLIVDAAPAGGTAWVRGWDLAASEGEEAAWTVGARGKLGDDGVLYVDHIERGRIPGEGVIQHVVDVAELDGEDVEQDLPQDPGPAAVGQVATIKTRLPGYTVWSSPERGKKALRARPLAARVKARKLAFVAGPHVAAAISEFCRFPHGRWKDQVDAVVRLEARVVELQRAGTKIRTNVMRSGARLIGGFARPK